MWHGCTLYYSFYHSCRFAHNPEHHRTHASGLEAKLLELDPYGHKPQRYSHGITPLSLIRLLCFYFHFPLTPSSCSFVFVQPVFVLDPNLLLDHLASQWPQTAYNSNELRVYGLIGSADHLSVTRPSQFNA